MWVRSLVRELRSHMPRGQKAKHKTEAICQQIQYRLLKWSTLKTNLRRKYWYCNDETSWHLPLLIRHTEKLRTQLNVVFLPQMYNLNPITKIRQTNWGTFYKITGIYSLKIQRSRKIKKAEEMFQIKETSWLKTTVIWSWTLD